MTIIRLATLADVDAIVGMGLRFQTLSNYAKHLSATEQTLTTLVGHMLSNEHAAIWLVETEGRAVGMLAAALYQQPMSGELVGSEICWWMEPASRGGRWALRLLRTAEGWAKSRGATIFQMMAPTDEVGAFYRALKYEPIETHYQRRLA